MNLLMSSSKPIVTTPAVREKKMMKKYISLREGVKNKKNKNIWNFPNRGGGFSEGSISNKKKNKKKCCFKMIYML